jgi:phage-related protein (TIGR01555 family)
VAAKKKPAVRVRSNDSMRNFVSGLGGERDKAAGAAFVFALIGRHQLDAMYRGDWLSRKLINIPADDATREWRAWQAKGDQIEKLEEAERKLNLPGKVRSVLKKSRLYGGGALVMGVKGTTDPAKELKPDTVSTDGLEFVHVMARHEINAGEIDRDVMSPFYGEPQYYEVQSSSKGSVRVHPSRVIRFVGHELPSLDIAGADGWGDSVLQVAYDAMAAAGQSHAGIAALIQEAKTDVINIPGLGDILSTKEGSARLTERFQLATMLKSLISTLLLDEKEVWNRHQVTFTGLTDTLTLMLQVVCGAADIPVTRMLGQSPGGLNATGESDLTNYYDHVASEQSNTIEPLLNRLDEILIRSALGSRPDEIYYDWNPLWQMSDSDKSTVAKTKAETFQIDFNAGLIDQAALMKGRVNQLVEDGTYPGLEAALEEVEEVDEDNPDVQAQFASSKGTAAGAEVPQDTALNGAQISSLLGIVTATANKEMPPETAVQLIMVGFPLISQSTAEAIINPLKNFEPPPPPPSPFAKPGQESNAPPGAGGKEEDPDAVAEEDPDAAKP